MTIQTSPTPVIIRYANGECPEPMRSLAAALAWLEERWPNLEFVTDPTNRTLVWRDGETAENDDGAEAVAEIVAVTL